MQSLNVPFHIDQLRSLLQDFLSKYLPKDDVLQHNPKVIKFIYTFIKELTQDASDIKISKRAHPIGKELLSLGIPDDFVLGVYKTLKENFERHPCREVLLDRLNSVFKLFVRPYILADALDLELAEAKAMEIEGLLELINSLKGHYLAHFRSILEKDEDLKVRNLIQEKIKELKKTVQEMNLCCDVEPYDVLYWRLVSMCQQEKDFEKFYTYIKEMDRLVVGIVGVLNKLLLDVLSGLAFIDSLTGLYNRNSLPYLLKKELSLCKRYNLPLSFVMLDVDNFKLINDTYGHHLGDRVISFVGSVIRSSVRLHDTPVRWGGEEFLIILPNTPEEGACMLAERIRKKVEMTKIEFDSCSIDVTVSAGVSQVENYEDPEESIKRADRALYMAKRLGKNRVATAGNVF
ncbi:MAG: GGDEF domain-containing protein [Aquificaceae bacterium]|nr:GGDEF domain-containing protein [Aquificaceae bacterium]